MNNGTTLSSTPSEKLESSWHSIHSLSVEHNKDSDAKEKESNQGVGVRNDPTNPVSIGMLATTITPFSIFVKVTVPSPSLVWCGVKDGSIPQTTLNYLRSYGSVVSGTLCKRSSSTDAKTFAIPRLQPNTHYPLLCASIPQGSTNEEDIQSKVQDVMTGDGREFLKRSKGSYLSVNRNPSDTSTSDIPYLVKRGRHLCLLFDDPKT